MAKGAFAFTLERFRQVGTAVPLGALADIRVVTGPPMIKDEMGVLVGYVLEEMQSRMAWVVPLTLVLVVFLLRQGMRGWPQTALVLTGLPFGVIGSVWLLHAQSYNVSTAVWVGLIAVIGTASETGILMIEFLDQTLSEYQRTKEHLDLSDIDAAVVEGAASRVRPIVMSVASTVLGLLPLLWEAGPGADVSARIAAPVIGGLVSCMVLTLLVVPAAYVVWRRMQMRAGTLAASLADGVANSAGAA